MSLAELYARYRAAKIALDQAAKEEEKIKKALKVAMEDAGEKAHTDADGYLFERIVQQRKSMDEAGVLESLKERGLTDCITSQVVETVNEEAVLEAINEGKYPADELNKYLTVKEIVMLKMTKPGAKK